MSILNRILRKLTVRRAPKLSTTNEAELLNYALDLAQEWGEEWLQPIQDRLQNVYSNMSQLEAIRLNTSAQAAMNDGHNLVYSMAKVEGKNLSQHDWQEIYAKQYPWVDKKNLNHLFSTGMYYAWKDGLN